MQLLTRLLCCFCYTQVCRLCNRLIATFVLFHHLIFTGQHSFSDAVMGDNSYLQQSSCRQPTSDVLWMRLNSHSMGAALLGFGSPPTNVANLDATLPSSDDNERYETIVSKPLADKRSFVTPQPVRHSRKRRRREKNSTLSDEMSELQIANSENANLTDGVVIDSVTRRVKPRRAKADISDEIIRLSARTSWHCGVQKYWKRMSADVYPPFVQTGRCVVSTCMLGLYECRPVKYVINVLRKNVGRHRCVPVPMTNSSDTTYEQAWRLSQVHVIVACQCSNKRTARYNPNYSQMPLTP